MARDPTTNYSADVDTLFQWATTDGDFFDRELDLSFLARAVERHDHSAGRGIAISRIASGAVTTATFAAGAVDAAAIGAGQVGTTKIANAAVTADKVAVDAVGTTKIINLAVTTDKIAEDAVTAAKVADGVAVANLGFTPLNKAGDTATGAVEFKHAVAGAAPVTIWNTAASPGYGLGIRDQAGSDFDFLLGHDSAQINVPLVLSDTLNGGTPWTSASDGAGSGLDADLLDGQQGAFYATAAQVAAAVPTGAVVMFRTQAELTAAGASWTVSAEFAGRLPVGVGTTFTQTFAENSSYGLNWTPVTGLTLAALSGPTATFSAAGGPTPVGSDSHSHTSAINGQGGIWHPPMYAVVFGRKI